MMEEIPYTDLKKGVFLIATPEIDGGIFFRSVILLCEHTHQGSFGLMVNKRLDIQLPEDILDPERVSNPKIGIRAGGPVQANQMMLLHTSEDIPQQTLEICNGVHLGGDLNFLHETVADEKGAAVHLCFGYAGWGDGQLQQELLEGHWFVHQANVKYVFETPVEDTWRNILRDMGGRYATLSMIPEDLSLN